MRTLRHTLTTGGMLLTAFLVFTASTAAQSTPALTTLYNFAGYPDAAYPYASLVIGRGEVLYGTTSLGGTLNDGAVFSLTPPTSTGEAWTETVYGLPDSGAILYGSATIGTRGFVSATTYVGGNSGLGTVFVLKPSGSPGRSEVDAVLHEFAGSPGDGAYPGDLLIANGVLYGTTCFGGASDSGTVYSLTPPTSEGGAWTETLIYSFSGGSDGACPIGPFVSGTGGVFYGATYRGGISDAGTVFSLTPPASPGGPWTEAVLHTFASHPGDGEGPQGGVVIGSGGVLYGSTVNGGRAGYGTVFRLRPPATSGGQWNEDLLYSFTGGSDGGNPYAGVVIGSGGVLYGTAAVGGTSSYGTVFSLTRPASADGAWTEHVLYSFTGGSDGGEPYAGVVIGSGAVLYGATLVGGTSNFGTVFSLTP